MAIGQWMTQPERGETEWNKSNSFCRLLFHLLNADIIHLGINFLLLLLFYLGFGFAYGRRGIPTREYRVTNHSWPDNAFNGMPLQRWNNRKLPWSCTIDIKQQFPTHIQIQTIWWDDGRCQEGGYATAENKTKQIDGWLTSINGLKQLGKCYAIN